MSPLVSTDIVANTALDEEVLPDGDTEASLRRALERRQLLLFRVVAFRL
jgi:hypothetical protein